MCGKSLMHCIRDLLVHYFVLVPYGGELISSA